MTKYDIVEFEPGWFQAEINGEPIVDTNGASPERVKERFAIWLANRGFTKRLVETVEYADHAYCD